MTSIDLNADLGEGYGPWRMGDDDTMMDIVTSANIACGGHAGDAATMHSSVTTAGRKGVVVGAHPGFDDKPGFGRRRIPLSPLELQQLIASQLGALAAIASLAASEVRYIKPHGALGNWAAVDSEVSRAIVQAVKCVYPEYAVLAISGTQLEVEARRAGLDTYSEIFADRGYGDDGNLVPRSEPGAMIEDPAEACTRLLRFLDSGKMPTVSGGSVSLAAHSICIHGDSAHAVSMARAVRQILLDNRITVAAFKR